MGSINIYVVQNALEEKGWKLISTSYRNLDSELEMECPKGHKQLQTFKQWRKYAICEQCMAGDPYKVKKNKVPIKTIDTDRVLALDAATNVTGYSIYDNQVLVAYGTYKVERQESAEERINQVKKWLQAALEEWQPDFVGIENIQLQSYGNNNYQVETYRVLANLQGVLIDTLYESGVEHELVSVNTWRNYCGVGEGRGRENKKKQAQDKVKLWYGQECTQDEADAICIGKYFSHLHKKSKFNWGEDI